MEFNDEESITCKVMERFRDRLFEAGFFELQIDEIVRLFAESMVESIGMNGAESR